MTSQPKKSCKRVRQTATHTPIGRGARFFLSEVKAGRTSLAELKEAKYQIETNPRPTDPLMADVIKHYYADTCEAIRLLEQQQSTSRVEQ